MKEYFTFHEKHVTIDMLLGVRWHATKNEKEISQMKKILVLLLAFALLACTFAACGVEKPTETEAPSGTAAPSATVAPSETEAPSTEAPSTEAPSTEAPSTEAPSTEASSTEAPSTEVPSTEAPSTEAPSTEAPSTEVPSTEAPSAEAPTDEQPTAEQPTDEGGEEGPGLDEYENAVLWHTPVLDGELDEEYYLSYNFEVEQFSNLQAGVEDSNAYSNRSHVYVLWDGEYVYFAVELYDDDMLAREPEYLVWVDEIGDINPWCNDVAEIWYSFELTVPEDITDVNKLCYDAYGQGEGPFSSVGEGIYSKHFNQSAAAAKLELGYDPEDEEGFCDRSVIEFKIPAKSEGDDELAEGDPIYFAVQINDIKEATFEELMAAGYNPIGFTPDPNDMEGIGSGFTYTYGRAPSFYPLDGELNGYSMGTLTTITPASLGE